MLQLLIEAIQQKYDIDIRVTSKGERDGSSLINAEIALTPKPVADEARVLACHEAMKKTFAAIAASLAEDFAAKIQKTHSSSP